MEKIVDIPNPTLVKTELLLKAMKRPRYAIPEKNKTAPARNKNFPRFSNKSII